MAEYTTGAAYNDLNDIANSAVFFFIVPPGAPVEDDGVFVAHGEYPPTFLADRGKGTGVKYVPVGKHDVYATWDDAGAHKYEILAKTTYDFYSVGDPSNTSVAHVMKILDSPRRIHISVMHGL